MKEKAVLYLSEGVAMLVENAASLDATLADAEASADWLEEHAGMLKAAPKGVQEAMESAPFMDCPVNIGDCLGGDEDLNAPCLVSMDLADKLWNVNEAHFEDDGRWRSDIFFSQRMLDVCRITSDGAELVASVKIADIRKAIAAGPVDDEGDAPKP